MRANQAQQESLFNECIIDESGKNFPFSSLSIFSTPEQSSNGCKLSNLYVSDRVVGRVSKNSEAEISDAFNNASTPGNSRLKLLKAQVVESKIPEIDLNSFFAGSNACQLFVGKNSEIVAFNEVFAKSVEKLCHFRLYAGALVTDYMEKPYVAEFVQNYNKALTGKLVRIKQQISWNDETIWCHLKFAPARNYNHEIIGVFFNLINVTKKIELKQKVSEQKQALAKIAFIQSHEVRRPVASILGLMNLFKAYDYVVPKEELLMMEHAVNELDEKIREIINHVY